MNLNWLVRLTFSDGDIFSWKKVTRCPSDVPQLPDLWCSAVCNSDWGHIMLLQNFKKAFRPLQYAACCVLNGTHRAGYSKALVRLMGTDIYPYCLQGEFRWFSIAICRELAMP